MGAFGALLEAHRVLMRAHGVPWEPMVHRGTHRAHGVLMGFDGVLMRAEGALRPMGVKVQRLPQQILKLR